MTTQVPPSGKVVIVVGYLGGIFDADGVPADSPHERAWLESLQELMENEWQDVSAQTSYTPGRFTPQVYQEVMAGMPRMSGARAALKHFGVPDAARRAEKYVARKQVRVVELVALLPSEADRLAQTVAGSLAARPRCR